MSVETIEFFDDRFYKINDKWYPSVTTVLSVLNKPGLDRWRGDLGNREADMRVFEAQWRGKRIHTAWEAYCLGNKICYKPTEQVSTDDHIMEYQDEYLQLLKLHEFAQEVQPEFQLTEEIVYNDGLGIAGTVDNLLYINEGSYMINGSKPLKLEEGYYICDLKTGSLHESAFMQLAAYASCITDIFEIKGGLILHTKATTRSGIKGFAAKLRTCDELAEDYVKFANIKKVFDDNNKLTPKEFEFPKEVAYVMPTL